MTAIDPTTDDARFWDTTAFFASPEDREFLAAHEGVGASIDRLAALYDRHEVRGGDVELTDDRVAAFEEVLAATNGVLDEVRLVGGYLNLFVTTDATDDRAQTLSSALQARVAKVGALRARLAEWIAALGPDALAAASPVAADHLFALQIAATQADKQMSEAEEDLAAALSPTGGTAWNRLYGDVTSTLTGVLTRPDGTVEVLPVTALRALASSPDRSLRRTAYEAELAAWPTVEIPVAACLNAIKGEANTLNARRGWDDPLDVSLFVNRVDRDTLAAMQSACVASFPDFQRYFRAKARLLGVDRLAWYDLFAPVGDGGGRTWDQAKDEVSERFGAFSGQLGGLADRAFAERWIDVDPRAGKRGGAFCMGVTGDVSRILLNFDGTVDGVQTLAHELGHAYHNTQLADRTPLQRQTPMALAETASIFCETLSLDAALADAAAEDRLSLLEVDLIGAGQVVVDIHSRFLFETRLFAARRNASVPAAELCQLMLDAQAETYGDALDPDLRHPYMWAVKPHYYSLAFYNWPYTYGLLFGLGLFARYQSDPERFRAGYDDLLGATGLADAAGLAARFDIDVRDEGFWTASLDVIRARIDDYEMLAAAVA